MPISHEWDVYELLAALIKEIKSREIFSFMNYSRKYNKYRRSGEPDGAALNSGSNQSGQSSTIKYNYCRKNHKSHKCNLITYPPSQKAILRTKSKCLICHSGDQRMSVNDPNHANENAENSSWNVSPSSLNFCNAGKDFTLLKTAEALISWKNSNCE